MKWHKAIVIWVTMAFILLFTGCESTSSNTNYTTNSTEDYGIFEGHIEMEREDLQSGLFIFPEKDTEGMTLKKYFYHCETCAFDNSYQICLTATFDTAAYAKEVARLSNVQAKYNGETHRILKADEGFAYPAYVSIFGTDDAEYALLDKENSRIIYVYHRLDAAFEKDENIPQEYLSQGYVVPDEYYDKNLKGYFMYYFEDYVDGALGWEVVKEQ